MKIIYYNIKYGFFAIIWMGLIWLLSSQSVLNVGLSGLSDILFKKSAHIFVYAILGLLLVKLLLGYRKWNMREDVFVFAGMLILVFFIGVLFSISDELHQSLVPGRTSSVIDIGIDIIGLFFGLIWGLRIAEGRLRGSLRVFLTK